MLTNEEKSLIVTEIDMNPEISNAGADIILNYLNAPGSANNPTSVVKDTKTEIFKAQIVLMLSDESCAAIQTLLEGTDITSKAFRLRWNEAKEVIDLSDVRVRGMIEGFHLGGLITEDEKNNLLALGEELSSRSYEMLGRKLTLEEIEDILNG